MRKEPLKWSHQNTLTSVGLWSGQERAPKSVLSERTQQARERAVKAYLVFVEQNNKSLARTEFFELFGITEGTAAYTLLGTISSWSR